MVSKILALDRGGFYPSFIAGLESQLDCSVGAPKTLSDARAYLATNLVNLAIVNPYHDQLGPSQAYVDFIKNDLGGSFPVLIFSRTGVERIAERTGLVLGIDYAAYLRKQVSVDEFVRVVRGLLGKG